MDQNNGIKSILCGCRKEANLFISSEVEKKFEELYLAVRNKEGRILDDDIVRNLPAFPDNHPLSSEWKMRAKSANRIWSAINKTSNNKILDLGCGNGWFSGMLAKNPENQVLGMDINSTELRQAARLFSSQNCSFVQGNIFEMELPKNSFTHIVLNASIQYFENLADLLLLLTELICKTGSIYIIDSPIYKNDADKKSASERTMLYYKSLGYPEMSPYYFHHTWDKLHGQPFSIMYNPQNICIRVLRTIGFKDSPFYWVKIEK
jgi:2-polyprenyl-3-methyl-5-hydroxy-6-metoxy-1,4-benzoquinol methylase